MNLTDTKIEGKLLGSLMLFEDAYFSISDSLSIDLFTTEFHKKVFASIEAQVKRNETPNVYSVTSDLRQQGFIHPSKENIGFCIMNLTERCPNLSVLPQLTKDLQGYHINRKLTELARSLNDNVLNGNNPYESIIIAENALFELNTKTELKPTLQFNKILPDVVEEIALSMTGEKKGQLISTGFTDLDKMLGGIEKGNLVLLAARPSNGKTSLAQCIIKNVADQGKPVHFFSLEMTNSELTKNFLSQELKIDRTNIKNGNLTQEEFNQIANLSDTFIDAPIYIDDIFNLNYQNLRAKVKKTKQLHNTELIVIDYLQLMQTEKQGTREREVSELSRNLKMLAKEVDTPIILLSQLSRAVESRASNEPQLSDLRESGSLEQDANIVMFIYEPDDPELISKGIKIIKIAKNRAGAKGLLPLYFTGSNVMFEDCFEHIELEYQKPNINKLSF